MKSYVSIPSLYRMLNSRSKYIKCLHVYHQKEIKPFLPDLFFDIHLQYKLVWSRIKI